MAANRCSGHGCRIWGRGSHRSARRHIRSQVIMPRWLRRRSDQSQCRMSRLRKAVERRAVLGHRVVLVVPAQNAGEPAPLFGDGLMHASPHFEPLGGPQLRAYPFRVGDPLQLEPPRLPGLRARVRKAEKLERLRLTEAPRLTTPGGEPPELDEPRLLGVQLQGELREFLSRRSAQNRSASSRCSNPPRSHRRNARSRHHRVPAVVLHWCAQRSKT